LAEHATSELFDARTKAALAYADAMTTSQVVADSVFERVREHFSEDAIVALTAAIAWEICASKFNRALEIEAQGICLITTPAE
jgi:alkylhydroperoxidase family enzyme